MENSSKHVQHTPWNKGVIVGQKSPFKLKEIWAIRVRLQLQHRARQLVMFDLGLDSKLRACDLVKMRVRDICHGEHVSPRATVMQQKTSRAVQFEITQPTREAVSEWIKLPAWHAHKTPPRPREASQTTAPIAALGWRCAGWQAGFQDRLHGRS